jgi:galactokinase
LCRIVISDLLSWLSPIYGQDSPQALNAQCDRVERALARFRRLYGPGPVQLFRAPGRVNLIGEHTDYNHGYVMPMALDKDVMVLARARSDAQVRLGNVEEGFGLRTFEIGVEIPRQPLGDWANYAQGPAQLLAREYGPDLMGCDALVAGDPPLGVPRGAGLSSSSALTVAFAVTLVTLNRLPIQGPALAEACGRAEWYVGTRGGIMDQFISVLAHRDQALFLDCRPCLGTGEYTYRHVPIPSGHSVVVVDSRVKHANTGPLFNRRVAEGRIGVRLLQERYPHITHLRDVDDLPWSELESLLPETIGADALRARGIDPDAILDNGLSPDTDSFRVRQRCHHVITENRRVLLSIEALQAGDTVTFGRLMQEAHASARDDYEISTPEIEALVAAANAAPGCLGARLTGAGWGGCIVALVETSAVPAFVHGVTDAYRESVGYEAEAFVCRSAPGAGHVLTTLV